ncbi:MAG: acyltransferase [Desulfovibrionaceae bacterium]|nr:acyltransferase [Desulfovibrionaceae bacterium]
MKIEIASNYEDDHLNKINYDGSPFKCDIEFHNGATNNIININGEITVSQLKIHCLCNNALINIGKVIKGKLNIQTGEDCKITIKDNLACGSAKLFAAEGCSIYIGEDCMFATGINIKTHDHHPIFDVLTEERLNISRDIIIEDHVWFCENVYITKGSIIKSGSIIGYGSFVSGCIPNNCIAAGVPAKIIKKNIAWEPALLNWDKPYYKPNAKCINKSKFWSITKDI